MNFEQILNKIVDPLIRKALDAFIQEDKSLFASNSVVLNFDNKESVFKQKAPSIHVGIVVSGILKMSVSDDKEQTIILDVFGPGQMVALSQALEYQFYNYSYSALTKTKMILIEKAFFIQMLNKYRDFSNIIMKHLNYQNNRQINRMINILQKQLPGRIANSLLYFAKEIYNDYEFELPFSRKEYASFISTSRESLIRTLSEFKNDRLIEMEGKRIKINSIELIEKINQIG